MPFKKRFTFHHSDKGKIEIIPHFTETQKLGCEHGFWWYEQKATTFQSKEVLTAFFKRQAVENARDIPNMTIYGEVTNYLQNDDLIIGKIGTIRSTI